MEEPTIEPIVDENEGQNYSILKWKCK
jgi:hypothetical protein